MEARFVDCHSHVVPSGDDGAKTLEDGLALCELATDSGTAILFATPHVWPHLLLSEEREREVRRAYEQLARRARLELRLGYELTPTPPLLREDPARYALAGTDVVLVEMPVPGPLSDLVELAEHVERAGLTPLVAHPERTDPIRVPVTAIYTRRDAVVSWPACIDRFTPGVRHVEVTSTHLGLGLDPDVWRIVAAQLAEPADGPRDGRGA